VTDRTIALREATSDDYPFMRTLYGSTRQEEMARFPFTDAEKESFLDQQFAAQYRHYAVHYPSCERRIIEIDGEPAGRLWVDEWSDQIRIVDIAIMPEWRGTGIGRTLLRGVMERASAGGKPVTIHVEAFNPALTLYRRLGFVSVDTNGVYLLMKWTPAPRSPKP
jgi:ribosomal protein S18 acetylase RimI-like enzyme